jgi:23S rRNA (uracil1939-C5)-methyltransferase
VLKRGDTLSLCIEKPAAGGWMIARADGQVILVSGVVPGERAKIQIDRVGKGVAYGRATTIEEPSSDRRVAFIDPACGGCSYAYIAYPRQLAIKAEVIADGFGRIGHISWAHSIAVAPSPDEGYRMRARLHIRDGHIGFFREGTHELCDARGTRQLLPRTCDVLDHLGARLRSVGAVSGELELSENIDASDRVAHLETSGITRQQWLDATGSLEFTGVSISVLSEGVGQATVLAGDQSVTDIVSLDGHDIQLRRHVQAFFQGNRFLLRDLVAHVIGHIEPGDHVVDLYAGAGLFSMAAAIVRGAHVTAVEGDRFAAHDLALNAAALGGEVDAVHQSVELFASRHHVPPAVLILDPPRTGMSREALNGAIKLQARRIVYVSCDVATLARDTRRLLDAGYDLHAISAFDLFPNTPHVETVVVLTK